MPANVLHNFFLSATFALQAEVVFSLGARLVLGYAHENVPIPVPNFQGLLNFRVELFHATD